MPYGWGGAMESVDCSSLITNVFSCFGYAYPRNCSAQWSSVGMTRYDVRNWNVEANKAFLSRFSYPALLYMPGHVMSYVG